MNLRYYETSSFGMGTIIEQKVASESFEEANQCFRKVIELIKKLECKMSYFIPESYVSRLNSSGGKKSIKIDSNTFNVLKTADVFYRLSSGAFDVTAAPLTDLWRICINDNEIPSDQEIQSLRPLVSGSRIELDENNLNARVGYGQSVDLGGIGKGFAADTAIKKYKELGITSAFINFGGNVHTLGTKINGKPWMIGIQNPRSNRGNFIAGIAVAGQSVVTSGDYEKYFESGGKIYHHIIDPKTGYPSDSGLISATVLSPSSMEADALSTAVFVLGLKDGMELIEKTAHADGVLITKENKVFVTKNLKDRFIAYSGNRDYQFAFYE